MLNSLPFHSHKLLGLTGVLLMACESPGDGSKPSDGTLLPDATNDLFVPPEVSQEASPILVAVGQSPLSPGGELRLGPGVDSLTVRIVATDVTPVVVTGIGWSRGSSGLPVFNQHVGLSPSSLASSLPFQLATPQSELSFTVRLVTPYEDIVESSPSTLIITSEFTDVHGVVQSHEFPLVIAIDNTPRPTLMPSSHAFLHEPGTRHDVNVRVYQERGDGWFYVTRYELESPSTELELRSPTGALTKVGPLASDTFDVSVTFRPQSETLLSNAILVHTDTSNTPLRIPLTSVTPADDYELSYGDPNKFDFRGVTSTTMRSATLTNTGNTELFLLQPTLAPSSAAGAFQVRYFALGSDGGAGTGVTSWPRGLEIGGALRIEISHTPRAGSPDAQLTLSVFGSGATRLPTASFDLIGAIP